MNKIDLKNVVWKEGKYYVSWNLNTGVSSFGNNKKEALDALEEALELHLENVPLSKIQKIEHPILEYSIFNHA
ncbi:type II toxin-antitoxin system HicB family antitoxin [Candidatus Azambacteria bacterium]|nr:type II toxin-antitoxin system HicB family antitoxin [Candidatus Azambacteria bacterium]